ncbi:helix-turn-helix domain-containing protein [Paenibacillus antibioticophila]|uniref:helix-turn-helix domain-containing protein n=1 Tax=Paenibacillus antibioticophila TaxID=1274374 RepID=UPI0037099B80
MKAAPSGRKESDTCFSSFFDSDFSKRLSSAMEDRGLDAIALAMLANVSPVTVERWLNGNFEPRHKNLARIANALDVSDNYLLG